MDAIKELSRYKKIVDARLEAYFKDKEERIKKIDPLGKQALRFIKELTLAGGKRIRPAFMYWGYLAAGGKEIQKIIDTSLSIELVHIFLLIHDDIIDRDDKRHGIKTLHKRYEDLSKKLSSKNDHKHVGNSFAIIAGDMAATLGNHIIFDSKFDAELILKALSKLQDTVSYTVIGEMRDVWTELIGKTNEAEVLKIHENKTAKYTVEGPLHLGAILGGAGQKLLDDLSAYAVPIGIGFQIQDDILGIYGDEKKLGKPVGSDLIEGKQTLLIIKALEKGNSADRKFIKNRLGRKDLTREEIERFRNIIKDTGSLDYSRNLAEKFIKEGKAALGESKAIKDGDAREFLLGIANYLIKREL